MQNTEPNQAVVIPFPARPALADQQRLKNALADLLQALDGQKTAVVAWRASLGELRQSVSRLEGSMSTYRANLAGLASGVERLNHQARDLARITDAR